MSKPVIRTPTGERLAKWFKDQIDILDRATEECTIEAREYIRGQMKVLARVRDHVLTEVAYVEVEAITLVTNGATLQDADQWLTDATGEETPSIVAA